MSEIHSDNSNIPVDASVIGGAPPVQGRQPKMKKRHHRDSDANDASQEQVTPITQEGERPQKKFYRQRAHCNPLSHNDTFEYPARPDVMDWTSMHYPDLPVGTTIPTVLDVGCGFGGLTIALAKLLPHDVVLGLEIRAKVTEYVRLRIINARQQGSCQNASVLRTNSMKFLPNYIRPHSLNKMFFCFPDPHFKRKNHGRRIIAARLLTEYAYLLRPDSGRLYCITDVHELHEWHVQQCDAHPLFARVPDNSDADASLVRAMQDETEEGQKVTRNGGAKYYAIYQCIANHDAPTVTSANFFG